MANFFWDMDEEEGQKMIDQCPNVFVYGTLKTGRGNNSLLRAATFIGTAKTKEKFALADCGCPYAFPEDVVSEKYRADLCHPVIGEVFRMNDVVTACDLDTLEGYPWHYNRRVIEVELLNKSVYPAWIYTNEDFTHAAHYEAASFREGSWVWV